MSHIPTDSMTIDTSKGAVERLANAARSAEYRHFPHGVFADTFDALAAERDAQTTRADAAEAEVARLTADLEVRTKQRDANALTLEAYRKAQETVLADNVRLDAENERLRGLTVDEVERIINQTEPAQMSDCGDRIWTRRMAFGIVTALQRKAGE